MPKAIIFCEERHDGSRKQHRVVENPDLDIRCWDWHATLKAARCRFEATHNAMSNAYTLEIFKPVGGDVLAWRVVDLANPYESVALLLRDAVKALAAEAA